MLVAVSGSQGSGKSTILKLLNNNGFNTIDRKTSRSVLEDWGITLAEVNDDTALTLKFQEEITKRKYEDEVEQAQSDELYFTERTHADLFVYALVTLGYNNEHNAWLNSYYKKSMEYNQMYSSVYYLRAGHFDVASDGTRGSGVHYSRMVDLTMLDVTQQMINTNKLTILNTPDLEQRLAMISIQSDHMRGYIIK
jgi:predicted ATPase